MDRRSKVDRHIIYGIHITDRVKNAGAVQQLLTKYGCSIQTRIGLHEVNRDHCSPSGMILLEMFDDNEECEALKKELAAIGGVEVKEMIFEHADR